MTMYPGDDEPLAGSEATFRAKVTGSSLVGTVYRHSWVEVAADALGGYAQPQSARYGSASVGWLRGLGGAQIATDTIVWAALAGYEDGKPYYDAAAGGAAGTTITVRDIDLTPTRPGVNILEVDQASGIVVGQNPLTPANIAQLFLLGAGETQWGVVTTAAQAFGGTKTFTGGLVAAPGGTSEGGQVLLEGGATSGSIRYTGGVGLYSYEFRAGANLPSSSADLHLATLSGSTTGGLLKATLSLAAAGAPGAIGCKTDYGTAPNPDYCFFIGTDNGGTATTGGLTFKGGLYISGTFTGGGGTGFTGTIGG
jgi:hypothetical protein